MLEYRQREPDGYRYSRWCELLLSGKQDEKTYCLTEKCSQRVERCLTKHAPVASRASGRANSSSSIS